METPTSDELLKRWREEILGYLKEMGTFRDLDDPGSILRILSGFSARATYINNMASQSQNRKIKDFKVEELSSFLRETEFQFRIWSRVGALNNAEWEMSRG
jgi:hypothetical protein